MSLTHAQIQFRNITIPTSADAERSSPSHQHVSLNIRYYKPTTPNPSLPTLILLPFWGGSAATFDNVLLELSSAQPSTTCIAVSYRGTGSSSKPAAPEDEPRNHDIPVLAADVLGLLASDDVEDLFPSRGPGPVRRRIIVCAHSMSAKVTWEILRLLYLLPATAMVAVEGVILLAPAPIGPLEFPAEAREQQLRAYATIESATWTLKNVLTSTSTPSLKGLKGLDDDLIGALARDCVGMSPGAKKGWIEYGMKKDYTDAVRRVGEALAASGVDELKGKGRMRVRVLVGEEDQVETVQRVRAQTVDVLRGMNGFDVEFSAVAGSGHLLPVEAPQEVVVEVGKMFSSLT